MKISDVSKKRVGEILKAAARDLISEAENCGYTKLTAVLEVTKDRDGIMCLHRCRAERTEAFEYGESAVSRA